MALVLFCLLVSAPQLIKYLQLQSKPHDMSQGSQDSQEGDLKDTRRQRLKDIPTWRHVRCDESQELDREQIPIIGGKVEGGGGAESLVSGEVEGGRGAEKGGEGGERVASLSRSSVTDDESLERNASRNQVNKNSFRR